MIINLSRKIIILRNYYILKIKRVNIVEICGLDFFAKVTRVLNNYSKRK